MPFDPKTAVPIGMPQPKKTGFDPSTATDGSSNFSGLSPAESDAKKTADTMDQYVGPGARARFQGETFGFGDEMTAGLSAGLTGVANIADYARGKKPEYGVVDAYEGTLKQERQHESDYAKDYPISNFANEVFGGALNPVSNAGGKWIGAAAGTLGKAARGGIVGMGYGGAAGFGSGKGDDFLSGTYNRLKDAVGGAGFGLVTGAVPPVVAGAAGKLKGPAEAVMKQAAKTFRSSFRNVSGVYPEEAIEKFAPEKLKQIRDTAIQITKEILQKSGKEIKDITEDPAHKLKLPASGAEAIGPPGETYLASLARRPGETANAVESFFRQRGNERADRMMGQLSQASGLKPEHIQGNMEDMMNDRRLEHDPLYKKAYSQKVDESDPILKGLLKQEDVQEAVKWGKSLASREGMDAEELFKGNTIQKWDYIKRGLGIEAKMSQPLGKKVVEFELANFQSAEKLRNVLFKNADYKKAVGMAGDTIHLEKAYSDAPKFMSSRITGRQFDVKLNDMSHAEVDAFKAGWVNDVYNKLRSGNLRPNDLKTPEFSEKAGRLLGEKQARQFTSEIEQEMRLKGGESSIPSKKGSQSMPLIEAARESDAQNEKFINNTLGNLFRYGVHSAGLLAARDAMWNVLHAMKTPEQEAVRNEVGKILLMKPDKMRALLEQHGRVQGGPSMKAKEIAKMLSHLAYGASSGAAPAAGVESIDQ